VTSDDEKALIALLIAAYLLSKEDTKAMASAIETARIDSAKASYQQSSDTVGADTDWEPDDDLAKEIKDLSEQDAEGIADTYEAELSNQAEAFVTGWVGDHDSLDGCEDAARIALVAWALSRAAWKSEQIANYSCGAGANVGVDQWILDLLDEDFDLPDDISVDDIELTVLPEESSSDECEEYAGEVFDIDEYDSIPDFPIHSNCIHRKVVQLK
jgi:hypothetical protein